MLKPFSPVENDSEYGGDGEQDEHKDRRPRDQHTRQLHLD